MVQYYRDMCPRQSHVLDLLIEADSSPKGSKIVWNGDLVSFFKELNHIIFTKTLLSYPCFTIPFTVFTDASGKKLGAVISQNNKPIAFFSISLIKLQINYTMTEKETIARVECLKKFHRILFGYEINVFLYHKIWYMP